MDFTTLDLHRLAVLWKLYAGNFEIRESLEKILLEKIESNNSYSIEYIYDLSIMQNHAVAISFIPISTSYLNYGEHIVIEMILNSEEEAKFRENILSKPLVNTYGVVKAIPLVQSNLTEEQIYQLREIGFNTNEILEIMSIN